MGRFSLCCNKDDIDAQVPSPRPSVSSSGSNRHSITRFFNGGEALMMDDARFFPEDIMHKLEIKFKDGEEPKSKMKVFVDDKMVKKVELNENILGNASFMVNGREIEFTWDITRFSTKLYFSYEGSDRVVMLGVQSSSAFLV